MKEKLVKEDCPIHGPFAEAVCQQCAKTSIDPKTGLVEKHVASVENYFGIPITETNSQDTSVVDAANTELLKLLNEERFKNKVLCTLLVKLNIERQREIDRNGLVTA